MRRWKLIIVAMLTTGCVGKNNHELVKMQLDATRTALSTHQATSRADIAELEMRIAELEVAIVERRLATDERLVLQSHLEAELEELRAVLAEALSHIPAPPEPEEDEEPPVPPDPDEPEPEPFEPIVQATIDDMMDALRVREEQHLFSVRREEHHAIIRDRFGILLADGWAEILQDEDAFVIRIPVSKLFVEGKVMISPRGAAILEEAVEALKGLPGYSLEIRGHTDNTPHHSSEHPSNWELGFDRAIMVRRYLTEDDLPLQITASSYADTSPLAEGDSLEVRKRNARVELWLTADHVEPSLTGDPDEAPGDEPGEDPGEGPAKEPGEDPEETPEKAPAETP